MKNFLFLLLLFSSLEASSENYSIVFIHIGKEIPYYTETAISQARSFNPNCSVILLANQEAINNLPPEYQPLNITYVACESLVKSTDHEQFLRQTPLDDKWKNGFWIYTSERFLYLADLMNQYGLQNVFHLENDNMLYVDLAEILPAFKSRYQGIAATFDNDERCIAGFIYIPNSKVMNRLAKCFADHSNEKINDMEIIAIFKNENSDESIDHLPIIPEEYVNEHILVSARGHRVQNSLKYCQNIDLFNSIFDAAALGQYLGGIDPKLGISRPGYINKECVFNPSLLEIEWYPDEQHRNIPCVVYPHAKYRINNLHIHSKKLKYFKDISVLTKF